MYRENEQPTTDIAVQKLRDTFRHVIRNVAGPEAGEDVTPSKLADTLLQWLTRKLTSHRERDEMASTDNQSTCYVFSQREQNKPRPTLRTEFFLIMSQIYRKWATMRLKHLSPWLKRWPLPQMYAGVPGQGAAQAWWQLSLCMEYWKTRQTQATGEEGTTDIYKFFDQIVRPLIYMTARDGGEYQPESSRHTSTSWKACKSERHSPSPTERRTHVSAAYRRDVTALLVRPWTLQVLQRGAISAAYRRDVTALLVKPWILQVLKRGAIQRVLADDLHIVAASKEHCAIYLEVITDQHLHHHSRGTNYSNQELCVLE